MKLLIQVLSVALGVFTLWEVNYPMLTPKGQMAIFALLGIVLCFLEFPAHKSVRGKPAFRVLDLILAAAAALSCGYVFVQTEPMLEGWWSGGVALGDRAGVETSADFFVGAIGILVVLEVTRRSIGLALPLLAGAFIVYAWMGPSMPDWLFPHRGYGWERIVSTTFLQSQGVFGIALSVMFTYVFLFVIFGGFLEATGATQFIIDLAKRIFSKSTGGPAKVSVLSSGLMGSLSGSAVANTAATGTFTIPMMRTSGFESHVAGGISAAASSGGALMPPIMGAGAYMMLEIIDPPVTYLEIIQAALLPAVLYYISLLLICHFYAKTVKSRGVAIEDESTAKQGAGVLEGSIFFGSLAVLILLLVIGYTPFRAVTISMGLIFLMSQASARTRIGPKELLDIFVKSARNGVSLVAASTCVGIVIGVVTLTGVGTRFASLLLPIAQDNLMLALLLIMTASIILGMGLPSAVCYLLLATIIGPPLSQLGVAPLAAHMFIFYFGMMSMVTPPVALAGFTAASIAKAPIMATSTAAFRFALVGFSLPYVFVAQPQLLMLAADGSRAPLGEIAAAFVIALIGVVPLAAGIAGYLANPLSGPMRAALLAAAVMILYPMGPIGALMIGWLNYLGLAIFAAVAVLNLKARPAEA